jgi:hypothetical protein
MYKWTVFIRNGQIEVAEIDHDMLSDYGKLHIIESFPQVESGEEKAIVLAFKLSRDGGLPLKSNELPTPDPIIRYGHADIWGDTIKPREITDEEAQAFLAEYKEQMRNVPIVWRPK